MSRSIVLLLMSLLPGWSCHRNEPGKASIRGELPDAAGTLIVLQEVDTHRFVAVDSALADQQGRFSFDIDAPDAGFWVLRVPDGKIMVLLVHPSDELILSGSIMDFPGKVSVKGAPGAELLDRFYKHTRLHEQKVDSLETLLIDYQDSTGYVELTKKVDSVFKTIWEAQRAYETGFIEKNPGSLASLVVLNYAFGMSPVLNPEEDLALYHRVDSILSSTYPGNKHVVFHHQRLRQLNQQKK